MGRLSFRGAVGHQFSRRSSLLVVLGALLLLVAGCATAPSGDRAPETPEEATTTTLQDTATSAATGESSTTTIPGPTDTAAECEEAPASATFVVDGRTFTAELAFCAVSSDGEALLHGHGGEVGTDVTGYFTGDTVPYDGSFTGEFRFDVGATSQFESSDEFVSMGDAFGELTMTPNGDGWAATGPAWTNDGTDLGEGTVEFVC